ncbi:MAG: cell envelope integrity protein TolA [Deltaproteobacteria bacterium]|jgi:colicin import membrane protein|nr:cell envelope integrity protein TolA [Deltaproteobacteria bacterium]
MRLGSYLASILLHAMLFLLVLLWPSKPHLDLSRAVQISLVDGAPGGELQASPVLGQRRDRLFPARAEAKPAPDARAEAAPEARPQENQARTVRERLKPAEEIPRPESVLTRAEQPEPLPGEVQLPGASTVQPQPDKSPEIRPETGPKPEQKQAEQKKVPEVSREDAIRAALADAQKQAKPDAGAQRSRQDAVERALADAARQSRNLQGMGGGGGEGDGPGGGGIKDIYKGLVIMAVRPNWNWNSFASRENTVVTLRIKLDRGGNVLDCHVEKSSGNPGFDGDAVNAVRRTKVLPPPPTAAEQDLSINFNSQDFAG